MTLIEKLTDEELSRLIAEKLEPKPEWTTIDYATHISSLSDGKCWIRDGGIWPRNMVNDPAMTVMLLEHLIKMGYFVSLRQRTGVNLREVQFWAMHDREQKTVEATGIGRAVAEAFAKSEGL